MILDDYVDLLPSYMGGVNIERHGGILDEQDTLLLNNFMKIEDWLNPRRPIMVEMIHEDIGTYPRVRIHFYSEDLIQYITVSGDFEDSLSWELDDALSEYTLEYTQDELWYGGNVDAVPLPELTITMETFDGATYKKSYPENDEILGDEHDHDSLLDALGALLNVPRRMFKRYPQLFQSQAVPGMKYKNHLGEWVNGYFQLKAWIEDDYYYSRRLQLFIENIDKKELIINYLETIYNYFDVQILHLQGAYNTEPGYASNRIDRGDLTPSQVRYVIAIPPRDNQSINVVEPVPARTFIEGYMPITRPPAIVSQRTVNIYFRVSSFREGNGVNYDVFLTTSYISPSGEVAPNPTYIADNIRVYRRYDDYEPQLVEDMSGMMSNSGSVLVTDTSRSTNRTISYVVEYDGGVFLSPARMEYIVDLVQEPVYMDEDTIVTDAVIRDNYGAINDGYTQYARIV